MSFLQPAFFFVLALSLLVLVHEWGHFWVARRTGVRVLRFSIGFGPELLGWTQRETGTRFSVCGIPFGGYVKFAGDNPEEDRDGLSDEFLSQSVGVRSAIVLAGPAMNYVLAILLYAGVIWAEGDLVYPAPRVGRVVEDTVADRAGVKQDDVIVAVNGEPVENGLDLSREISGIEDGESFQLEVRRGEQTLTLDALAGTGDDPERARFGVEFFAEPLIGVVKRGSPAWNAGLRPGDRVLSVDGHPVDRWSELQQLISARPEREVAVAFEHEGARLETTVTPEREEQPTRDGGTEVVGRIGIQQAIEHRPISPAAAMAGGVHQTWRLTVQVLELIPRLPGMIFNALFRGHDDGGLGGPVRMAQLFGEAARWGVIPFFSLMAFISTQLAIFNLLPIPVLDGGHMALYTVEVVTRRPPSIRVRIILQQIGFAILLLLMLSVTVMDIGRVFG